MSRFLIYTGFLMVLTTMSLVGKSQDSMVIRRIYNNKIELLMPSSFKELSYDAIARKFPNQSLTPAVMWAMEDGSSSIKVVELKQAISDKQIPEYRTFHVNQMKKGSNLELIGDGVKKTNGRNVGFIKAIHTNLGTYAHYCFLSLDNKLILIAYNSFDVLRPSHEAIGDKIANSLTLVQ